MSFYLPIAIIVISNIFYNICSKSTPDTLNPFASLTVTYLIGAVTSAIAFFAFSTEKNILLQYKNLNWSSFVLGISIVGLEVGSIYMYKAGWNISTGHLVHSCVLDICLIIIGYVLYKEAITPTKILGILICICGLYLINK